MMALSDTARRNAAAIVRLADLPDSSTDDILARFDTISSPGMRAMLDDPNLPPEVIEQFALALRLGFEHGSRDTPAWQPLAPPAGKVDN